nr:hypothetical protein [Tanacetum cinerariifolium]
MFAMEKEHPEQPESVNDTHLVEQGDTNTTLDSSNMSNNGRDANQDDDLTKERELLASLIEQMKLEIDGSKKTNKSKSSNKLYEKQTQHPEQPESVNDTHLVEQGDTNTTLDSSNMSNNGRDANQDDDLTKERELLASLIEQMKLEIDGSKKTNKSKSSNKLYEKQTRS